MADKPIETVNTANGAAPPPDRLHLGPTFGQLFIRAVRRYPERTAIVAGGIATSYAAMGEAISRYFQLLVEAGVGEGTGVALLAANRPEALYLRVAIHLTGARFTPLNPLGAEDDHHFIVADSQSQFLVLEAPFADRFAGLVATPGLTVFRTDDLDARAAAITPQPLECRAQPDGIASLQYTGGTTGAPKGIIQSHRTLVTNVLMCLAEWDWPRNPRILLTTPLSHAAGLLAAPVLVKGGSVHLRDGFDAGDFLDAVETEAISVSFLVPTMVHALVNYPGVRDRRTSSLELVVYGAAPISPALLGEAIDIFGPVFLQLYAQSEAPMTVTTLGLDDHDLAHPERLSSCGFPMVGVEVKLLDDDGREVAHGEVGEICVRGPLVMDGYWNRPEETEATLKGDWLHTGDMAREDACGFLYIVDRKKDMIITGGFNVYPKEVEDVLATHPDVAQVAVFGVPDARWGEAVKAAVVPQRGRRIQADELMAYVRARKGPVSAPKSIDVIDAMPETAIGKPDKKALRAPYWAGVDRNVG